MSNINIVTVTEETKVTVETKTVEVPDCTELVQEVERLNGQKAKAAEILQKSIEVCGGSILEQICTYLNELFKPVPIEYLKPYLPISANNDTYYICISLSCKTLTVQEFRTDRQFVAEFASGEPVIVQDEIIDNNYILFVAQNWKSLKNAANRSISRIVNERKNCEKSRIEALQASIDAITNFEL